MPPAGSSSEDFSPLSDKFSNVEPRTVAEQYQERQQEALRQFQVINQMRIMVHVLAEQFRRVSEETARIREEHKRIRLAIAKQQRDLEKQSPLFKNKNIDERKRILKHFFSKRKRRQAFPEEAKRYFASIR